MFLGVTFVIQLLNGMVLLLAGMSQGLFETYTINGGEVGGMNVEISRSLIKIIALSGIEYIFWIVVSFFASSTILNKKIDI